MGYLNRHQILGCVDLPREEVPVPEWGEGATVFVRPMRGIERGRFEARLEALQESGQLRALAIAYCAVDADGRNLFSEADVPEIGNLSAAALDRVFAAIMRINRVDLAPAGKAEGDTATVPTP